MFSHGKEGLNDIYDLYKAIDNDRYKVMGATPVGKVYAKDTIAQQETEEAIGSGTDNINRLTIITNTVHKINVGDFLKNRKTGEVWRVASIPSNDDDNEAKKYSLRPPTWTTLSLEK